MLRDDLEVALNDLIVAVRQAADAYATAAEIAGAGGYATHFSAHGDDYQALAKRLESEQRKLGHLPKAPDSEMELVREVVSRAKAGLLDDRLASLLPERQTDEERIAACAAALLALELPGSLHRSAKQAAQQAKDHAARLAAMAPTSD